MSNGYQVDPQLVADVWKDKHSSVIAENVLLTAAVNQLGNQLAEAESKCSQLQGELNSLNNAEE